MFYNIIQSAIYNHLPEIYLSIAALGLLLCETYFSREDRFNSVLTYHSSSELTKMFIFTLIIAYSIILFQDSVLVNFGEEFNIDVQIVSISNLIYFSKLILCVIAYLVTILINESIKVQRINFFEFYALFLLSLLALLLMLEATNLLFFYLTLEASSLCFYALTTMDRNVYSAEGALKYFTASAVISGLFLLGMTAIYSVTGTLELDSLRLILPHCYTFMSSGIDSIKDSLLSGGALNLNHFESVNLMLLFAIILITSILLFKLAVAPFHFWMPDAYEGAPLSTTVILTIMPKLPFVYFSMKWLISIDCFHGLMHDSLIVVSVLSVIFGLVFAIRQVRFKRMILYSSILQVGFITFGFSASTPQIYASVLFFVFVYLITMLVIWSLLILWHADREFTLTYYKKDVGPFYFADIEQHGKNVDEYSFLFLLALFSLGGIPPFLGFLGKYNVTLEFLFQSVNNLIFIYDAKVFFDIFVVFAVLFLSACSVFYYIRVIKSAYFNERTMRLNLSQLYAVKNKHFVRKEPRFVLVLGLVVLSFSLFIFFLDSQLLQLICELLSTIIK